MKDLSRAGGVIALGVNFAASHPIAGTALHRAVMNGARLITANPVSTAPAKSADMDLQYYPGSETALIGGLIHLLLEEDLADPETAAADPQYFETLKQNFASFTPQTVAEITGVHHETLMDAAHVLKGAAPVLVLYGLGFMESPDVKNALNALASLLYITGSFGKSGGGMIPAFGAGNFREATDLGMTAPDLGEKLASGKIKAVYVAGESFTGGLLDSLSPWLGKVEFIAVHDVTPPSQATANLVLPMASVLEKGGTLVNSEREQATVEPVVAAPGDARSVEWLVKGLARFMKVSGFGEGSEAGKSQKQGSAGSQAPSNPPNWTPEALRQPEQAREAEFGFDAMAKEAFEPYFLGPLLAEEARAAFYPGGEIEMNPAAAFGMGLTPGDTVRVTTAQGEWQGSLGMNSLLPSKVVATPLRLLPPALKEPSYTSAPAKVEKVGEPASQE